MNMLQKQTQSTVLIVDDDVISASILQASLNTLGYERVGIEHDGQRALERLREESAIELVLLDLHMPEMDGIRFMRHLCEIRPAMDLIMVSGQRERVLSTAISLGKSMGLNVLGALQKPIKPNALEETLQRRQNETRERKEFNVISRPLARVDLEAGLDEQDEDNKPCLLFQPIVSVSTGEIVCVEVLARWWNKERGMLSPDAFLPLAERSGLLDQLTTLIYRHTIEQVSEWLRMDKRVSAAINLSINSFRSPEFTRYLIDTAAERNIDCARLNFEVAESQTSAVTPQCLEALLSLRLRGFRLSIDDFGTASSSFTHLKDIPFTELKIDREFVTGATHDAGARSILEESINLARRLSMSVVAEGVESRQDWDLVENLGCDFVQGYYCAKPMGQDQLLQLLETWQGPHGDKPESGKAGVAG